jgi:hypothetical protein
MIFASPAWVPAGVPPYPGLADGSYVTRPKYDPRASRGVQRYVLAQFALGTVGTAALMFTQETAPRRLLIAGAVLVVLTLVTSAGLLEQKRWARPLEAVRLVLLVAAAVSWSSISAR